MTKKLQDAINALKEIAKEELSTNTTSVKIFINCQGVSFKVQERTAEELKRDGISMRNIQGDFIH
jgi:DNA-binding IscR family transcriptional regulator